jgi:hypothetical protein
MAKRDYIEERAAGSEKSALTRGRRTAPYDRKPYSPAEIDKLYAKSQIASNLNTDGGDGLQSQELHDYEAKVQQPSAAGDKNIDGRLPDYFNDVAKGSYLRGHGKQGAGHLDFDKGGSGFRYGGPERGEKCTANGKNAKSNPFSSASRTYGRDVVEPTGGKNNRK